MRACEACLNDLYPIRAEPLHAHAGAIPLPHRQGFGLLPRTGFGCQAFVRRLPRSQQRQRVELSYEHPTKFQSFAYVDGLFFWEAAYFVLNGSEIVPHTPCLFGVIVLFVQIGAL